MKLTFKNTSVASFEYTLKWHGLPQYFSRAEFKKSAESLNQSDFQIPAFDTFVKNNAVYPVAYETYYVQNEYFEIIECYRFFYEFK